MSREANPYLDSFECPRCGHCCPQQTEQEPVAWMYVNKDGECEQIEYGPVLDDPGVTPLYTAPPKQWVGLTDEEIFDCEEEVGMPQYEISSADLYAFVRAIEAKLREKNT